MPTLLRNPPRIVLVPRLGSTTLSKGRGRNFPILIPLFIIQNAFGSKILQALQTFHNSSEGLLYENLGFYIYHHLFYTKHSDGRRSMDFEEASFTSRYSVIRSRIKQENICLIMADTAGDSFYLKLYALQKRLKGERLFIRQDKDIIRSLNDSVTDTCKSVYHLAWRTRQHWRNLDRLVSGKRVFPSECTQTSILIESAMFEDASKHLGYQDARYGEFLASLRSNPKLVALVLNCATNHGVDVSGVTSLLLCCLYGSCILKEDVNYVLSVLKHLIEIQVSIADDVFQYFCNPKSSQNAFNLVLSQYSELLFTSKLYLTASLHGAVMQIIVDDLFYLDIEISHVLNRLPPKLIRQKFGDPGTPTANKKMAEYIESSQNCLINLCKKFLKGLRDKIYCFPTSLRWILHKLMDVIINRMNCDEKKAKALLGHVLMHFFICPAIVNPEPFGINSDAFITEVARYNLSQVAWLLRSLALAELGMKDLKMHKLLEKFEPVSPG